MNARKISIIMPVYNEAKTLQTTLNRLQLSNNEELIVVDGGSSDNSVSIAKEFTDKVYVTETGRARVMNYGASQASGKILLFLHADCTLPKKAFSIIRETLGNDGVIAGSFDLAISHPGFRYRVIEAGANLRSRVTSIPYGDQGIFLGKEVFHQIGGFTDIPLMEDIDISRRLKKTGKIAFVRAPIQTSARRWIHEGIFYTTLRDWVIALLYSFFNASPKKLIKYYRNVR
jgi:rSAM/selenodomain-associated transferase 2